MTPKGAVPSADDSGAEALLDVVLRQVPRFVRGFAYALAAALLVRASDYDIYSPILLIATIGFLGLFTESARVGQFGLAILMLMAVIPREFLSTLLG